MRIAGGIYGSRTIEVPKSGEIRPTQERVREALFSMLMSDVDGARFLDLFAGSGAVGLEALSRGCKSAAFVERDKRHASIIKKNIAALGADVAAKSSVIVSDAYKYIATPSREPFDIVFADPPYALGEERGYAQVLADLAKNNIVREGGIFVAEMSAPQDAEEIAGWELLKTRKYGKSALCIWRRESLEALHSGE